MMSDLRKSDALRYTQSDRDRDELFLRLADLDKRQVELALRFIEQVILCHDPDVVEDFLTWRNDPLLGSILQLGAAIGVDMREQLLFMAEDLYMSLQPRQ